MNVKVFYGPINEIEKSVNEWLKEVDRSHIVDIKLLVLGITPAIGVFIFWD